MAGDDKVKFTPIARSLRAAGAVALYVLAVAGCVLLGGVGALAAWLLQTGPGDGMEPWLRRALTLLGAGWAVLWLFLSAQAARFGRKR